MFYLYDFWFLERLIFNIEMKRNRTNHKNEGGNFGIFVCYYEFTVCFFFICRFILKGCEVGGSQLEGG